MAVADSYGSTATAPSSWTAALERVCSWSMRLEIDARRSVRSRSSSETQLRLVDELAEEPDVVLHHLDDQVHAVHPVLRRQPDPGGWVEVASPGASISQVVGSARHSDGRRRARAGTAGRSVASR